MWAFSTFDSHIGFFWFLKSDLLRLSFKYNSNQFLSASGFIWNCQLTSSPFYTKIEKTNFYDPLPLTLNNYSCLTLDFRFFNADEKGEGEICMWGRNVMMGYINREDKTNEDIDEEGWLHSGDLGFQDEEGFVFVTGQENISCFEKIDFRSGWVECCFDRKLGKVF